MAAAPALAPTATEVCNNTSCTGSYTHRDECTCNCGGDGHGIAYAVDQLIGAATFTARPDVARGFTRAMLSAVSDDEVW